MQWVERRVFSFVYIYHNTATGVFSWVYGERDIITGHTFGGTCSIAFPCFFGAGALRLRRTYNCTYNYGEELFGERMVQEAKRKI